MKTCKHFAFRIHLAIFSFFLLSTPLRAEYEFTPHPHNKPQFRDVDLALCCVFQNEAPWLKEWLEFHKLIGVKHFYLYNNLSSDNYLEVLQPYQDAGVVEIFDYPASPLGTGDQPKIYNHAVNLAKGHNDWLAIIDTDEFITPLITDDLVSYLKTIPNDVGGIEINWQCYGTSNIWSLMPGELLTEKLTLKAPADDPVNMWYKSIVRPQCVKQLESAHNCSYLDGYRYLRVTPCTTFGGPPTDESSVKEIRITHYLWRTKEYFYTVKVPRINRWNVNHFKVGSPIDYLPITNKIEDLSMKKYIPALKTIVFKNPYIHDNGYWLGQDSSLQHYYDPSLASALGDFFQKEKASSIADFGCGTGDYIWTLRKRGLTVEGYDGNPATPKLTNGAAEVVDLSQPVELKKRFDWIMSIEVGQQIPKEFQNNFLENIHKHCTKGVILSWAVKGQGGYGHLNQQNNEVIKKLMADYGFTNDLETENALRKSGSASWLKQTLMVFRKKSEK